ncbi:hypothetical protein EDB81DRAFT_787068 [Dactylonectria macrodidyma]|uniref:Nucleotidyltransferase family protein n=1 Tax=Dactylonectria macrodidyma TaxID=307937 RepID=A0A9P9F9P6_9HYPO|nr:hypothetical protein EDB81DRAFT_787068 [Dactylonectria macrodidyma]
MGFGSWLRSALGLTLERGDRAQRTRTRTPTPSSLRTPQRHRHASKPPPKAQTLLAPMTPMTEGSRSPMSGRSQRRRPRRSEAHVARHLSDPIVPGLSAAFPRPTTPRPSFEATRAIERQLREQSRPPVRKDSSKRPRRPKSESIISPATTAEFRRMDRAAVREAITRIAELFGHIPYVVCGLSAMLYYGFEGRPTSHIDLLCSEHSREALRGWAIAQGMYPLPNRPDHFGLVTSNGIIRQIHVDYVEDGFEDVDAIRSSKTRAVVLSLAGLADQIAQGYVKELECSAGRDQKQFATDMIWVLERIAASSRREHHLTPDRAPHIWQDTFWIPFTLSFPESVPLFGAAGIGVRDMSELPDRERGRSAVAKGKRKSAQRSSPTHRSSPTIQRNSPDKRSSPAMQRRSLTIQRSSPDKRNSPTIRRSSLDTRRSPAQRSSPAALDLSESNIRNLDAQTAML